MPLIRVYTCVTCGTALRTGFDDPAPLHCGVTAKWRQTREFKPEEHGWSTGQKSAAIGFRNTSPWEVPVQGADGQQLQVTSLREIRKLEKESEKMAADGIGQEMRFRAFNQDCKNGGMLTNSFGEAPHRTPKLFDKDGRQKISFDLVEGDPVEVGTLEDVPMGDGADEALASALGPGMEP